MRSSDTTTSSPMAPDLKGKRLHFVGIGGSGMSGLARLCAARGACVSGSDRGDSPAAAKLREEGFVVAAEQTQDTLPAETDLVVVSAAIPIDHPERAAARQRGVEVMKYAALLGQLMIGRCGVAVAGTHGKSTTTSILCHALMGSGLDPSFILGAHCEQIGGGSRTGQSDVLIAEACEYDRSFHHFYPTHGLILNVEADHLDLYASIDEIVESFAHFAALLPKEGSLLIQHESPHRMAIAAGLKANVETLGFAPQADWQIELDGGHVTLKARGQPVAEWDNPMPGDHFAYNAAAAAVTAHRLGAPWNAVATHIAGFTGLDRRMQWIGEKGGVTLVDDYGHHPTEVDTTLRALRTHHEPGRLICVFQPHQHSRTRHLMEQFLVSFSAADIVIVPEIYFVRDTEQERHAVTAGDLVDRLRQRGVKAMHLHPFSAIAEQLELMVKPGDLVVTMGAGDVWQVGRDWFAARGGA
ncbi:MAG: UDP-N-acetylmuramate--L-alanine ligase [Algisphaera sp.]